MPAGPHVGVSPSGTRAAGAQGPAPTIIPPRRALAWDLHLLAHALAQPAEGTHGALPELYRAWLQRPRQRARLGRELLLAARDRYLAARQGS